MRKIIAPLTAAAVLLLINAANSADLLFQDTFDDLSHITTGNLGKVATWTTAPSPGGKDGKSLSIDWPADGTQGWDHMFHDLGNIALPTTGKVSLKWSFLRSGALEKNLFEGVGPQNQSNLVGAAICEQQANPNNCGLYIQDAYAIHPGSSGTGRCTMDTWNTVTMEFDMDAAADNVKIYLAKGLNNPTTADLWTTQSLDINAWPINNWQAARYGYTSNGAWTQYVDDLSVYSGSIVGPVPPAQIGRHRQLFVDDAMIADTSNVNLTLHQPNKHTVGGKTAPVMVGDRPWETEVALYGTTFYDEQEQVYKMWYRSLADTCYICYATSTDGVSWTKPTLNASSYQGSTDNNICGGFESFYTDGFGVIKDMKDPDPSRRYKMLTYHGGDKFAAMVSADGVNWSGPINSMTHQTGDVISMYYDEGLGKYVGLTKRYVGGKRSRLITFSDDFENWTAPQVIMTPDGKDPATAHIYSHVGYEYEGMRIGYISVYDTATEKMDTQLVSSRDGLSWQRYRQRTSFLPLGEVGDFDSGMIIADGSGLVTKGGKIMIYYCGGNTDHDGNVIGDGDAVFANGLATLRQDGFVSADAGAEGGTLTTVPFVLSAKQLAINATTSDGGSIRVEMLDANGQVIGGYELVDSSSFSGDSLGAQVHWSGQDISESLLGETVRLKFYLQDASLYSFWFTAALTPGDANNDGTVDAADATILAENWQSTGLGWAEGDFNGDGVVNDADATILAANWQSSVVAEAAVPEPGMIVLLSAGLLILSTRQRLLEKQ